MPRALAWVGLAVLAGAMLGLLSRAAMRAVAIEAGVEPGMSLGGSVEVVLFGILVGAPVALGVWACRRRFGLPPGTGIAAGLLLFAALTVFQPPAATSALEATPDSPASTAALFAAACVLYGAVLDLVWRWRGRSARRH